MIDLGHLLLQLVVILVAARLTGRAIQYIGQPPVIGGDRMGASGAGPR
jgi:Kef-type K+ transport system membrane component KefB